MQIAGRPSDGWAKGQPEEAVFFGPVENFFDANRGGLWKTLQKKSKKVGTNPIDNSKQVRYNRGKLRKGSYNGKTI